ncbi:hypothetical protein BLNAU_17763 [Blattamonas nauphoetae]|uniref:Uncharacterized protein n=1 Tax=Blattamonas nauphoetae TaxID=2049346 RepID=A0ABQ9X6E7_9EUKA|nr:hypothetical protein BLNAU_17763 [Blattamonas nauphoetae]
MQKYLEKGFLRSLLSALDEQRLLKTPLSDPLHAAIFSFFVKILRRTKYTNISLSRILGPLESHLTLHLTHPTVAIFPDQASEDEEDMNGEWNGEVPPILLFLEGILEVDGKNTTTVQFVKGLVMSALEARRKEGVVVEGVSVPLLLSTQLHPDLEADELTPILDAASSFIVSHHSLSTADAADILIFLTILEALFFRNSPFGVSDDKPDAPPPIQRALTMSMSDDFRHSLARLLVLSILSANPYVAMTGRNLVFRWTQVWDQKSLSSLLESGTVKTLAHVYSELCPSHLKNEVAKDDLITHVFMQTLDGLGAQLNEMDETNENTSKLEQLVVDEILLPTRKSLVAFARRESTLMEWTFELDQNSNMPHLIESLKEVWEEVRREAVGIVENEYSSTVPSFLTLDLFSELSFESIASALSSLSSFITANPSPADPIASCAVLFLHKLKIDLGTYITVSSFPATVARTLPPLFATENEKLLGFAEDLLNQAIDGIGLDHPEWMAENGLFVNLMDVFRMKMAAESHPHEEECRKIETRNEINMMLTSAVVDIIVLSLSHFTSSSRSNPFDPNDADTDAIARIVLEKILEPCEGFITSSLRACLNSSRPLKASDDMIRLVQAACQVESRYSLLSEFVERNGFHLVLMKVFDSAESTFNQVSALFDIDFDQFIPTHIEGLEETQPDVVQITEVQGGGDERTKRFSVREMMRGRNEEGYEDCVDLFVTTDAELDFSSEKLHTTMIFLGMNVAALDPGGKF